MTTVEHDIEKSRLRSRVSFLRDLGLSLYARFEAFREARRIRRTKIKALSQLTEMQDWQLEDMGLTRIEVERQMRKYRIERDPVQLFERS